MYDRQISVAVIKRLPRYYRYLGDLMEKDVVRISSKELSEKMGVTASQIRQDLNNFGGFGQQGYGYNVANLYAEIGKILGLDRKYNGIIVGAGHIGQAIANYSDFERRGFKFVGIFDVDKKKIGTKVGGLTVKSVTEMADFIKDNSIHIAALTVPKTKASSIANELTSLGIKGIWNFAPTDLQVPEDVTVENVHLAESLMRLSYRLNAKD